MSVTERYSCYSPLQAVTSPPYTPPLNTCNGVTPEKRKTRRKVRFFLSRITFIRRVPVTPSLFRPALLPKEFGFKRAA